MLPAIFLRTKGPEGGRSTGCFALLMTRVQKLLDSQLQLGNLPLYSVHLYLINGGLQLQMQVKAVSGMLFSPTFFGAEAADILFAAQLRWNAIARQW